MDERSRYEDVENSLPAGRFNGFDDLASLAASEPMTSRHGVGELASGDCGDCGDSPSVARVSASPSGGDSWRFSGDYAPSEYPIDALGPLAAAAAAISEGAQVDPAMAGQAVLAAAALVVQHRFDTESLIGKTPINIYVLTIGESGDGKTTADNAALQAVRSWQREKVAQWRRELEFFDPKKDGDPPREPYLIGKDGTVEGIRRDFASGRPSQGVFTSEAAAMLAGYGMSKDHRSKTAATLNGLFDDGEISVSRGTTGRVQLYDRRFSLHWLIQPEGAREAVHDPLLSGLGFWPRFLLAWPAPSKPRKAKPFAPERDPRIGAFWKACTEHLSWIPGDDCSDLPVIALADGSRAYLGRVFEDLERKGKTDGGKYREVKPFAIRATELTCRVAGVLAAFAGSDLIDLKAAKDASRLVAYSLESWRSIFADREASEAERAADALHQWLRRQPGNQATEQAILHIGPRPRSRSSRDRSLAILQQAGRVRKCGDMWVAK